MTEEQLRKLLDHLFGLVIELENVMSAKKESNAGYNEVIKGIKENIFHYSNAIKARDMSLLPD